MLSNVLRFSAALVILGAWLAGCTSTLPLDDEPSGSAGNTLDVHDAGRAPVRPAPSSPDAGSAHVVAPHLGATDAGSSSFGPADAGYFPPAQQETGPGVNACTGDLASLLSADCEACEQTHCAVETASCYEDCRGLIGCAADACSNRNVDCVYDACMPCLSGGNSAIAWASCMESHCADSCPFVTHLPNPSRVPPPPPSDECHDDLPGTLGDTCVACFEQRCTQAYSECGDACRSLITCAVGYCDRELGCMSAHCGSCLGGSSQVQLAGECLATRCAAECPVANDDDGGI